MKAALHLKFSQNLALTPQLQQSIKLLQLSALELEQELIQAAEQNPLIHYESDSDESLKEPIYQLSHRAAGSTQNHFSDEDDDRLAGIQMPSTLLDHLIQQIQLLKLSPEEKSLVGFLAGNLDEKGYLAISITELADELSPHMNPDDGSSEEQIHRALLRLQQLEPVGVGAQDLAECLRLQLENMPPSIQETRTWKHAHRICSDYLPAVASKDWAKLKKTLKINDEELQDSIQLIRSLNHNPAQEFDVGIDSTLIPDVIVKKIRGQWQVTLNPEASPKISIHEEYAKVIKENKGKEGIDGLHQKLQEARWLVKNVLQRSETILKVAKAIVERQQNFFNHGPISMRPLVLREIADTIGMHESTVSRVTTQKYMATPAGCFEFKYFFGSQVSTDTGGTVSSTAIRTLIKQAIDEEDGQKPLSDTQIVALLNAKGLIVARRTIAKYRESLRIPAVHLRRK